MVIPIIFLILKIAKITMSNCIEIFHITEISLATF